MGQFTRQISDSSVAVPQRAAALRCGFVSSGVGLPQRCVTNQTLINERQIESTDEWIREKTGITQRYLTGAEEGVASLATDAALDSLVRAGLTPDHLDVIVVATCTSETVIPGVAATVQANLFATNAVAWDINSACSGFAFAFDNVLRYLQTTGRYGLIIGADCGSRLAAPDDRLTSIFFGDGAGALLVDSQGDGEVIASHLETLGDAGPLSMPTGGHMTMDGKAVWDYATKAIPRVLTKLCHQAGITAGDIDLVVGHQANANILRHAANTLGMPAEQFALNIDRYGNTVAASIPIAFDQAIQGLTNDREHLAAIVGFGGGLAAGGHLWRIAPTARCLDERI